eukprot:Colp12_sorted_trinity150504_noHs@6428
MDWLTGKGKKKDKNEEKKSFLEDFHTQNKIISGELKAIVALPEGEDLDEWLANGTILFFHHINLFYGTVSEFCTTAYCPTMTVGKTEYVWIDDKGKKIKGLTAPQYIDYCTTHITKIMDHEQSFPTRFGE